MSPLYVWECATCHAVEERLQVSMHPIAPFCEKCGPYMQQVFTAPSTILKGDGWAKKDRKEGKK